MKMSFAGPGRALVLAAVLAVTVGMVLPVSADEPARVAERFSRLPLHFEANQGQAPGDVKFLARGLGYELFLTERDPVIVLREPRRQSAPRPGFVVDGLRPPGADASATALRMRLVGALPAPRVTGLDELPGKAHYFIGNDPARWRTGVPTYARVKYETVYPGIDLVYYGTPRHLEYDFIVAPGADPAMIQLAFDGSAGVQLDASGNVAIQTDGGTLRLVNLAVYQEIDGKRQPIDARYTLSPAPGNGPTRLGFAVAAYDRTRPLVIDPVVYSTYLGGNDNDHLFGIAADAAGNAYVTGFTSSSNYPIVSPGVGGFAFTADAVVTKLTASGALAYSTYIGGTGFDMGAAIAVDVAGNILITGQTQSLDFPTFSPVAGVPVVQAFAPSLNSGFVVKLTSAGFLGYSTYLGAFDTAFFQTATQPRGIAVDITGNTYVSGLAGANFPTTFGAALPFFSGGNSDAFVAKLNASGTVLVYATYVGGSGDETGPVSIAVDGGGRAYVAGTTTSFDFPTTAVAADGFLRSGRFFFDPSDVFVVRLNLSGTDFEYSVLLGGSGEEGGGPIAVDGSGNAYVTGYSLSFDFPSLRPIQPSPSGFGLRTVFAAKINAAGTRLVYSTFLGGTGRVVEVFFFDLFGYLHSETVRVYDTGYSIAVDGTRNVYIAGVTVSLDFPTTDDALQRAGSGGANAFLAKLDPTGTVLVYSTYLGGSDFDTALGVAADGSDNAYVTGYTRSFNFLPIDAAIQPFKGDFSSNLYDGWVMKVPTGGAAPHLVPFPSSFPSLPNGQVGKPYLGNVGVGGSITGNRIRLLNLPAGLTSSSPDIFGTPTLAIQNQLITIQILDQTETIVLQQLTQPITIVADTIDVTPPLMQITSPSGDVALDVSTGTLTLGGTATDAVGVTQVTWVNDRGGAGTAAGTTTWSAPGIPLQGGVNTIQVTARDAAGHQTTATVKAVFFSDAMQAGLGIKAAHFTELLVAINAVRARFNLTNAAFSGGAPVPGGTILSSHLNDLRTAMSEVCQQAGCAVPFPPVVAQTNMVIASHLATLQTLIRQLR